MEKQMASRISSIRLDKDVVKGLTAMSKRRDRSMNYLVSQAVKKMISDDERLIAIVNEGIAQLDAGKGISHAEVIKRTQKTIDKAKLKANT
jgi:predicted transcriptional regulator